jgi:ADP-heptose:LPS heptosyltransferase
MKISTQRLIDRWLGQVLCGLLSVWWRWSRRWASTERPHPHRQLRVLVILLSEMGSVVLAGPMFEALKKRHPGIELHVLQLHKNQSVMQLLGFVPEHHLHSINDASLFKLVWSLIATTRRLRKLGLDGVIDCELFSRISALLSYASGARVRVGFTPHTQEGLYRGSFINTPVPYNPYLHISQQFLGLAQVLSPALPLSPFELNTLTRERPHTRFATPLLPTQLPPVEVGTLELQAFRQRLRQDFAVLHDKSLVLLYVSGGALPIRAWPEENYIALAQALLAKGHAVGLIGLPEDKPQALRVLAQCQDPACIDLTGYTKRLRELLLLFHCAQLLITNDGGPGHFASLTPIDCIAFFGPETSKLYGPIHPGFTVLEGRTACSPCLTAYNHRDSFCDGDNQCLKMIDVAQVLQVAQTKLALAAAPHA